MNGYIYKITFPNGSFRLNGCPFYIGQKKSTTTDDDYYGSGRKVRDWFRARGLNSRHCKKDVVEQLNVKKEILHIIDESDDLLLREKLNSLENMEINKHLNNELCLNLIAGGRQPYCSEETKKKISIATKKAMHTTDVYLRFRKAHSEYFTKNKEQISQISRERVKKTKNYEIMNQKNLETNRKIWEDKVLHEKRRQKMCTTNENVRKIQCIETGEIFFSINEAQKKYKLYHIKRALVDSWRTVGGYHWKYLE